MIRKSFIMQVKPHCHQEYKKRHDNIFPDLINVLKNHGVHNYSIFLDEQRDLLFAYVEIESEEHWNNIANTRECQKWWKYMCDIMLTNSDNSPISQQLEQVFYLP